MMLNLVVILLLNIFSFSNASEGDFSYIPSSKSGPSHWGELDPGFHYCSHGKSQSPIDVSYHKNHDYRYRNPKSSFGKLKWKLENSTVNFALNCMDDSGKCGETIFKGKKYKLINIHFHSPSEHTINGYRYPLEAHHVHTSEDGNLAVIAVLFQYGLWNYNIEGVFNHLYAGSEDEFEFNARGLVNGVTFCSYHGSLTTPPCSEKVTWLIQKRVDHVHRWEVERYVNNVGVNGHGKEYGNNRPMQKMHARKVVCFDRNL